MKIAFAFLFLFVSSCNPPENHSVILPEISGSKFLDTKISSIKGSPLSIGLSYTAEEGVCYKNNKDIYSIFTSNVKFFDGELSHFRYTSIPPKEGLDCEVNEIIPKVNGIPLKMVNIEMLKKSLNIPTGRRELCEYERFTFETELKHKIDCILTKNYESCCEGDLRPLYMKCLYFSYLASGEDLEVDINLMEGIVCK